jgi:NarL family two-component system response regulator LiaR
MGALGVILLYAEWAQGKEMQGVLTPLQHDSQERIRVLIVDDHATVRTGLKFFVLACDDLELVGEADCGEQALVLCAQVEPDVVLMDLVMPGMDGVSATRAIHRRYPDIHVIGLTSFEDHLLVRGALEAGAISYLIKNVSADELANAIRAAHAEGRAHAGGPIPTPGEARH